MDEKEAVMEILPETYQLEALISNVLSMAKRQLVNEISTFSLTGPQFSVLRCLQQNQNPQSMSQLTRECSAVMPTMTGIIKRLEARGLVARKRDQNDRRLLFINITPEGQRLVEAITHERCEGTNKFLKTLSRDERRFMIDLLQRYRDYMIDSLDVEPEEYEQE
jgi:DNA-binding MarR family transcriptional regulator